MKKQLSITANTEMEADLKLKALTKLQKLDATTLTNLAKLAEKPKAIDYVKNKFPLLIGFIG